MLRERWNCISHKNEREISYYILSDSKAKAEDVAALARNHWAIENNLHWVLDVQWGSDAHRVRNRTGAENLARLRRFCAGMVRRSVGWGLSSKGIRELCGWSPNMIFQVLAGEVIAMERKRVPNVNTRKAAAKGGRRKAK